MARVEVTPPETVSAGEVVTWELAYIPEGEKTETSITGTFTIQFTDDDKEVAAEKPNQQVHVMLVIQEVVETYKGTSVSICVTHSLLTYLQRC